MKNPSSPKSPKVDEPQFGCQPLRIAMPWLTATIPAISRRTVARPRTDVP